MASTPPFNKQPTNRRRQLQQFVQRNNPGPKDRTPLNLQKKPGLPGKRKFKNNAPFARY